MLLVFLGFCSMVDLENAVDSMSLCFAGRLLLRVIFSYVGATENCTVDATPCLRSCATTTPSAFQSPPPPMACPTLLPLEMDSGRISSYLPVFSRHLSVPPRRRRTSRPFRRSSLSCSSRLLPVVVPAPG